MISTINQKGFLGWIIVLVAIVISAILIFVNLPSSIPGDWIYPIKGVFEDLRLFVNEFNYQDRAEIYTDLSNQRLDETQKLIDRKDYGRIAQTLDNMVLMQKKALNNIGQAEFHNIDIATSLSEIALNFDNQQNTLRKLYFEVSPETYGVMDKAIESVQENLDRLETIKAR